MKADRERATRREARRVALAIEEHRYREDVRRRLSSPSVVRDVADDSPNSGADAPESERRQ